MGVNYNPSAVVKDLIFSVDAANTKSYSGSGTSWNDLSGNGRHFTLYNTPTFSVNNIQFDGVNEFATTSNVTISGDQTFSVWALVADTANFLSGLLTQHNNAAKANFGINQVYGKVAPSIGYTDGTREYSARPTTYSIVPNSIFNAVLVYNASENKIYWYIDGRFDSSYALTKIPKFTNWPICSGRWDAGYGSYYLNGRIYGGSIYGAALTASQVQQNFNAFRGRFGI